MNVMCVIDLTALMSAGKEFQFFVEDLLIMQDTVHGDFNNPAPSSTLPGTNR